MAAAKSAPFNIDASAVSEFFPETTHRSMLHVKKASIVRAAMACGLVAVSVGLAAPSAEADLDGARGGIQVISCSGTELIATLNPTIKDGTAVDGHVARYVKASAKRSDGTKDFIGNDIPADATTCSVDAGIRTDQAVQGVKYILDTTAGVGNSTLTLVKLSAALTGSTQCAAAQAGPLNDYPDGYPLQGKLAFTFAELNLGKAVQLQAYVRTYSDDDDPGVFHVTGTAIKGPGVGGHFTTAFNFLPTDSTKNINVVAGCSDATAGNAAGAELWITGANSAVDASAGTVPATVTLGGDDANENFDANPVP
jgi:hypothetical protein